jgi:hypothetical protein
MPLGGLLQLILPSTIKITMVIPVNDFEIAVAIPLSGNYLKPYPLTVVSSDWMPREPIVPFVCALFFPSHV